MRSSHVCLALLLWVSLWGSFSVAQSTSEQIPTDWDLYMMRLVNRARTDPAGENILQGSSYNVTVADPLAYSTLIGRVAQNHNEWMGANRNNSAIDDPTNTGPAPDSFSHYETLNALFEGPTGNGATIGWTGDSVGSRTNFVGYSWGQIGENIVWRSNTPAINASLIDSNHAGWWNSSGHRSNMMSGNFTVFGHHVMNDSDHWATQNFGRPLSQPYTLILGVLFDDKNNSGEWTPFNATDPQREGIGNTPFSILPAGGTQPVATGVTLDNGSFAANIGSGTFDVVFSDSKFPGGQFTVSQVAVNGSNVDLGDLAPLSAPRLDCDFTLDDLCDTLDIAMMYEQGNLVDGVAVAAGSQYDLDADLDVDNEDLTAWLGQAAHENGYASPFARGDTDDVGVGVLRDVDITDFNQLANHFDPSGATALFKEWSHGNFDGDGDIDTTDFNSIAMNFSPTGYGARIGLFVPEPSSARLWCAGLLWTFLSLSRRIGRIGRIMRTLTYRRKKAIIDRAV